MSIEKQELIIYLEFQPFTALNTNNIVEMVQFYDSEITKNAQFLDPEILERST